MKEQKRTTHRRPGGVNVHIYPAPLVHQSRMNRITEAVERLGVFDAVWAVGVSIGDVADTEWLGERRTYIRIPRPSSPFKVLNTLYWSWLVLLRVWRVRVTCVNCHSLPVLPICVLIKLIKRARLVYDTHELETETYYCRGFRKVCSKIVERLLIGFADEVSVVTKSIADWYTRAYGLRRVWLVRNVPSAPRTVCNNSRLRALHRVPSDAILFIYQGLVSNERGCHTLLRSFANASAKRHLVIMGDGPGVPMVKQYSQIHDNIHHQQLVSPEEVLDYSAGADIGIFLLPPNSCLSYEYSLGNKFFEYLHAGLAVMVTDNPEMAAIVREYDCGWIHRGDEHELTQFVKQLSSDDVEKKRARARIAAIDYNWDREKDDLRRMYEALLNIRLSKDHFDAQAAA